MMMYVEKQNKQKKTHSCQLIASLLPTWHSGSEQEPSREPCGLPGAAQLRVHQAGLRMQWALHHFTS